MATVTGIATLCSTSSYQAAVGYGPTLLPFAPPGGHASPPCRSTPPPSTVPLFHHSTTPDHVGELQLHLKTILDIKPACHRIYGLLRAVGLPLPSTLPLPLLLPLLAPPRPLPPTRHPPDVVLNPSLSPSLSLFPFLSPLGAWQVGWEEDEFDDEEVTADGSRRRAAGTLVDSGGLRRVQARPPNPDAAAAPIAAAAGAAAEEGPARGAATGVAPAVPDSQRLEVDDISHGEEAALKEKAAAAATEEEDGLELQPLRPTAPFGNNSNNSQLQSQAGTMGVEGTTQQQGSGVQKRFDPASNRPYWYNTATGQSWWADVPAQNQGYSTAGYGQTGGYNGYSDNNGYNGNNTTGDGHQGQGTGLPSVMTRSMPARQETTVHVNELGEKETEHRDGTVDIETPSGRFFKDE